MGWLVLQNGGNKYRLVGLPCKRYAESLLTDFWEAWATGQKSPCRATTEKRPGGRGKSTSKSRMLSTFPASESKLTMCDNGIARNRPTRVARPSWLLKFG